MDPWEGAVGVEPWDTEWAAERAAEALRYLGHRYPECLGNLRALDAMRRPRTRPLYSEDREGYLEALRGYMKAARDEALRIRRGAA